MNEKFSEFFLIENGVIAKIYAITYNAFFCLFIDTRTTCLEYVVGQGHKDKNRVKVKYETSRQQYAWKKTGIVNKVFVSENLPVVIRRVLVEMTWKF